MKYNRSEIMKNAHKKAKPCRKENYSDCLSPAMSESWKETKNKTLDRIENNFIEYLTDKERVSTTQLKEFIQFKDDVDLIEDEEIEKVKKEIQRRETEKEIKTKEEKWKEKVINSGYDLVRFYTKKSKNFYKYSIVDKEFKKLDNVKKIDKYKELDLFANKDNGEWTIYEGRAGYVIADKNRTGGETLKELKNDLDWLVDKKGIDEIKELIFEKIQETGLSPRYKRRK